MTADLVLPAQNTRFLTRRATGLLQLCSVRAVSLPRFLKSRLSHGVFVSPRFRYVFTEVPKAGCSTTKAILWRLEDFGPLPASLHARTRNDPRLSPVTADLKTAAEALFGPAYFRFTLWRDPVSRLASAYRDKIHLGLSPSSEWLPVRRAIADAVGVADPADITFDQFARYVCEQPDGERDSHWMSHYRVGLHDVIDYDALVRTDHYEVDMAAVLTRLAIARDRWPDLSVKVHTTGSREQVAISKETAALVRAAFAIDYQLLDRVPVAATLT